MFNHRLQPKGTALAVSVLFTMVGALGLAAGARQAGQSPFIKRPDKVKTQSPSERAKPSSGQAPFPVSSKPPRIAPARAASVESPRTARTRIVASAAGRRDPFKPWAPPGSGSQVAGGGASGLPPGIRGLVISQLRVEGIIRQELANNMIAVVTNYTKRAYFLRENDTVYNGVVGKITSDAVYFKENTLDSTGRVGTREVVLKLGSAPGEGR